MDISKLQIDHKVLIPHKRPRTRSALLEFISAMKISDSVWVSNKEDSVAIYNAICRCFLGSRSGKIAKVNSEDKRGEGYRVWRIK